MTLLCFLALLSAGSSFVFDWPGHRGARGLYPENTIQAMKENQGSKMSLKNSIRKMSTSAVRLSINQIMKYQDKYKKK